MKQLLLLLSCMVLLLSMTCKKDSPGIKIDGFLLTDLMGNNRGQVGDASDDWKLRDKLSDREMALFNFGKESDLDNTIQADVGPVTAFPNPASNVQYFSAPSQDVVLKKLVFVDANLKVLKQVSFKDQGIAVNVADRTIFMNKASVRVYFSYSAKGKPNFKVGYGDIKICDDALGDYMKCF